MEERPEYKATRELLDTGMYLQLPLIKKILQKCGIEWNEPPENEADDVIGSLASAVSQENGRAFISSNDLDFAQLITEKITLVKDIRGIAVHITETDFTNEWGFPPTQYLDYLALKGDPSDNVTGIRGIGPKTAGDLVRNFGSVQGIIEHLEVLSLRVANKIRPEVEKIYPIVGF